MNKRRWIIALLLAAAVALAGCGGAAKTESTSASQAASSSGETADTEEAESDDAATDNTTLTQASPAPAAEEEAPEEDPRAVRYAFAKDKFINGLYEESEKIYAELGDYEESQELYGRSVIAQADAMMAKSQYKEAAEKLLELEKTRSDVHRKRLDAQYLYAAGHMDAKDQTTYAYLKELREENYPGAVPLFDALYAWDYKLYINNSDDDSSTVKDRIGRDENICIHVKVTGGEPNAKTDILVRANFLHADPIGEHRAVELYDGNEFTVSSAYTGGAEIANDVLLVECLDADGKIVAETKAYIE